MDVSSTPSMLVVVCTCVATSPAISAVSESTSVSIEPTVAPSSLTS
ncbi:MAG: hypothetical protein LH477_09185 [Nocardioides sp.]|nr:hypothetical protein [Nocardioides sp.]